MYKSSVFRANVINVKRRKRNICRVYKNNQVTDEQIKSLRMMETVYQYTKLAEKINGRCAMQGFIWGVTKNVNVCDITKYDMLSASICILLVTYGSFVSFKNKEDLVVKVAMDLSKKRFTESAEIINGRLAMIALIIIYLKCD